MRKILLLIALLTIGISNGQFIVTSGGQTAGVAASTSISSLAQLQAMTSGDVGAIVATIDLVNTDVTIPSGVVIVDGGGSIVSSGTGELRISDGAEIEGSLLNYQLNLDSLSEGRLKENGLMFSASSWNIDEAISSPAYTNTTGRDIAINNLWNLQKAIDDVKLLSGNKIILSNIDFYVGNAFYAEPAEDTVGDPDISLYSILLPSYFTVEMDGDVHIRSYPHANRATRLFLLYDVDEVSVVGGNLYGERETHMYDNVVRVSGAATGGESEILVNLGHPNRTPTLVEHTVPLSGTTKLLVASSIAQYFDALGGYSASSEVPAWTTDPVVTISNDTPGLYELASLSENDTSGATLANATATHENNHAVSVQGGRGINIKNIKISDFNGDGVSVVGKTSGIAMTYANNSQRVNIEACDIDNSRRLGIGTNSVDGATIRNNNVTNAGQDSGVNLGTSPSSGIWAEPFRSRTTPAGVLTEISIAKNITVENNRVIDSYSSSITSYTSSSFRIIGNVTNNPITFLLGGENTVMGNTVDMNLGSLAGTTGMSIDISTDVYDVVVERGRNSAVSNNHIIGRNSVGTAEIGFDLTGAWKLNFHNNFIRNIGGPAIQIDGVTQSSKIHHNIIEADEILTTSTGIDFTSTDFDQLIISDNYIKVYDLALNNDGSNVGAEAASYNLDGRSLIFENNYFENWNGSNDARIGALTTYKGNHFMDALSITGAGNDLLIFDGNTFEDGLNISGTLTDVTNSVFKNNIFKSTDTTAGFDFESRGTSTDNEISNNIFYQSSGVNALLIDGSGTHSAYYIWGNRLVDGSPTDFINYTGSNSYFYDNMDIKTGAVNQTITGTGNTVN